MTDIAIRVQGLGKRYHIAPPLPGGISAGGLIEPAGGPARYRTLRETLAQTLSLFLPFPSGKGPGVRSLLPSLLGRGAGGEGLRGAGDQSHFWALKDITFELKKGHVLGIIGRNGAGKSTLLKILARVTDPTEGAGQIHGRVGSLLEVGTGFHPELTGRENIYLNGAILGMRRSEIARKFDQIVDFSEIGPFIDTPVKRYSSGMYLRLAFAVAAHLEPEILIVDEVLAVGDAEFQRKCLGKMNDVAQQGRTVLFVSHNMSAVLRLTHETIVIDKGRLVHRAPTPQAIDYYLSQGYPGANPRQGQRIWQSDEIPHESAPFTPIALRLLAPLPEAARDEWRVASGEQPEGDPSHSPTNSYSSATHHSPPSPSIDGLRASSSSSSSSSPLPPMGEGPGVRVLGEGPGVRVLGEGPGVRVTDTIRSIEPCTIEIEYTLTAPIPGLRVGIYLISTRGEYIFTSFDTDQPERFEGMPTRPPGRYISRCTLPPDFLNEGRFVIGVNASAYRVKRYFQDDKALTFTVDPLGAPGMHWPEPRMGAVRPRLDWKIEVLEK